MSTVIIIGTQWGDEGKGKIIDCLSDRADVIARSQGGHNAGHTVVFDDKTYILHLIPSGIFHKDKLCIVGNGVVIDPGALINEIEGLKKKGFEVKDNLKISKSAHVIFPYHIAIESLKENAKGNKKIGTTGRGIGPAYVDKMARIGIKMVDLLWPDVLREKLENNIAEVNHVLKNIYNTSTFDFNEIYERYLGYGDELSLFIDDTDIIINDSISQGKHVLFEGAQGTLLDVDHGTYPYVTSSNASVGGALVGLGVGPKLIEDVFGVVKSYTTRVGGGPFTVELNDETGEKIRERGGEFGATTGRPRRCGWLDLVVLRHSARINGLTGLIITKLDILDAFDKIRVSVGYKYKGTVLNDFPKEIAVLEECEPVYEEFDGWQESTLGKKSYDRLPEKAKAYIRMIEEKLQIPVVIISTGKKREDIIYLREIF